MVMTAEKLEVKHLYIGGSEAAAVLGLSRWDTPLGVWGRKTGKIENKDISGKLYVKLGNRLEEVVAELFTEETGKRVHRVNETIYHPVYDFLGANLDRRVVGEDAILECKTASAFKKDEWEGEEIPREYIIQCLHYLAVTGKSKAYIAVLIGNQDFKWKVIERDDKVLAELIAKEVEFWNTFVVPGVMPSAISSTDTDNLKEIYPEAASGSVIELGPDIDAIVSALKDSSARCAELEAEIEKNKNLLKAALGDSETGVTANYKITWKNQSSNRIDTERLKAEQAEIYNNYLKLSTNRVLRTAALKKGDKR